jgi:hypothetical protein
MKYLVISALIALSFSACKDDSTEQANDALVPGKDSIETLDTVFSQENVAFLNQLGFSQFARTQSTPVDWSKFSMVTSTHDSLMVSAFTPDKLYYQHYGKLLKYSPDSSMFVDLDSYNIEIHPNKPPIEHGPDTEVSLVDLANKQRTRLMFLGPGNGVEEAGWIDNDNILLIGYRERDTSRLKTSVIWRYHVPTKTFHVYESTNTTIAGLLIKWRRERLRQLQSL